MTQSKFLRVFGALAVVAVLGACAAPQVVPAPLAAPVVTPVVVIYGDSLFKQASAFMKPGATLRPLFGTAPCSWYSQMQADNVNLHPTEVVLAFWGNIVPCGGGGTPYNSYAAQYAAVRSIFALSTVVKVVISPPGDSANDNSAVAQAAIASGLPTIDARSMFIVGVQVGPDGVHLTQDGVHLYAYMLEEEYAPLRSKDCTEFCR